MFFPDVEFNLVGHCVRFLLNCETIVYCSSDNEPNVIVGGNKSPTFLKLNRFIGIWVGYNTTLNCNCYEFVNIVCSRGVVFAWSH